MNKWIGIGRLTRAPELRYLPSGVAVTTFTIAVSRDYKNDKGEKEADFIPILAWRGLAENCVKYLAKGRLVAVSGRIQTRSLEKLGIKPTNAKGCPYDVWGDAIEQ